MPKQTRSQRRHVGHHATCRVQVGWRARPARNGEKSRNHDIVLVRVPAKTALTEQSIKKIAKVNFMRDHYANVHIESVSIISCGTSKAPLPKHPYGSGPRYR